MSRVDANLPATAAGQRTGAQVPAAATSSDIPMSLSSPKVRPWHLQRKAIVYIRQSTPQQVLDHRESADRQYGLVHRAAALGWPQAGVEVVDEDQGRSGQTAEGRPGFQYLLAEISLDHVGVVFGLEMSRLARSNKDWHQLLELCAIFRTLLADADGLYDPTDHNDRLLLGLKGTMSEAELHVLRSRMYQGLLNKARRGEVFNHPPAGYIKLPTGAFALDPDEQVQGVIRLLFDQFERQGSINGLLHYLVEHDIRMPIRPHHGPNRGQLQWRRPNRVTLQYLLHHPIYAGYYRWGHRACDPRRKVGGRPGTGRTVRSPEECLVLLEGRCPAYITAERFWANQQRLQANRAASLKGVRRGPSLLGGLLVCARCGRHLLVSYTNAGRGLRYSCVRGRLDYGEPPCQSLSGRRLDALVSTQVLSALQPAALELHLAAAADVAQERRRLHEHWQQRLERARYEAERAARQYQAVEPENRLVARELERRWEEALAGQGRLTEEYERFCRAGADPVAGARHPPVVACRHDHGGGAATLDSLPHRADRGRCAGPDGPGRGGHPLGRRLCQPAYPGACRATLRAAGGLHSVACADRRAARGREVDGRGGGVLEPGGVPPPQTGGAFHQCHGGGLPGQGRPQWPEARRPVGHGPAAKGGVVVDGPGQAPGDAVGDVAPLAAGGLGAGPQAARTGRALGAVGRCRRIEASGPAAQASPRAA